MGYEANLVVVGAGSAGLVSAYIAAAVKAKVILIERHKMGGDCLNDGCIPSKALLKSAKVAATLRRAPEYGLAQVEVKPEFAQVMKRVHEIIAQVEPHDSVERYTSLGVECVSGEASILDAHTVEVNGERRISAKCIIIAAGARPFAPPVPGIDSVDYLTSESIWKLQKLPKRLAILGGGPMGCELGQAFAELGSDVTIIQHKSNLMRREDSDVFRLIQQVFESKGVNVLLEHKAVMVSENQNGQKVVRCESPKGIVEVECDELLVAVGRKANSDKLVGLKELGIKTRPDGTIETDAYLRTAVKNIYACGDITGPYQFAHVSAHQAWYATVNALFSPFKKYKADYSVIPWATFTQPEVARVGINEHEAEEKNIDVQVTKYEIDDLDRAICDGETNGGFVKVLTKPGTDKILGVTIVSSTASDLIAEYVLAMRHNLGLNKILSTIHLYPSNAEANKYVAGMWKKQNAPQGLLKWVAKFHSWRRS